MKGTLRRSALLYALVILVTPIGIDAGMNTGTLGFPAVNLFQGTFDNNNLSAMCVSCHTRNPSIYSDNAAKRLNRGTHFVYGGTSLPTGNKSLEKLDGWEQGVMSKYGNASTGKTVTGTQGELICESCHNLKTNVGRAKLVVIDNVNMLNSPLCEGCHTGIGPPGHHPMTEDPVVTRGNSALSTAESYSVRATPLASSEVTYPAANQMNCRSCHNPHNAQTKTGARLLKRGEAFGTSLPVQGADNTGIMRQSDAVAAGFPRLVTDFTPLCDSCHKASE